MVLRPADQACRELMRPRPCLYPLLSLAQVLEYLYFLSGGLRTTRSSHFLPSGAKMQPHSAAASLSVSCLFQIWIFLSQPDASSLPSSCMKDS